MNAPPSEAAASTAEPDRPGLALLAYGFRPFFLLAGLHAMVAIPVWSAFLQGAIPPSAPIAPLAWHAHEMIYGFVMAAVAGFLLTAVPGWTSSRPIAGSRLLMLVVVWLAGRVVVTFPLGLAPALIAAVDLAFPIALALAVVPSMVRSRNLRNLVFAGFLTLLLVANLRFHLTGASSTDSLLLAVNTVMVMVVLVGGRIVPAFTASRLERQGSDARVHRRAGIDRAAILATVSVLVADLGAPGTALAGWVAAAAAVLLLARLLGWQGHRFAAEPIVWVLHVAYAWLPVALALKAAWLLGDVAPAMAWMHALTIGAFATMILAVMSRAALGHTGRPIVASRSITVAYLLLTVAALIRVFGATALPAAAPTMLLAAAVTWTAAFTLFVLVYAPVLCAPRADGCPG